MHSRWRPDLFTPADWQGAWRAVPALVLPLGYGLVAGQLLPAMVVTGAAFSVGFGSFRVSGRMRWQIMAAVTSGLMLAAFAGSLLGHSLALTVLAEAALAALCGALSLYHQNWWWSVLQLVIAFVLASYYPNDLAGAAERAGLVAMGGLAQIVLVGLCLWLCPDRRPPVATAPMPVPDRWLAASYAARSAVAVALAMFIARASGLQHDYWAPMTAMLILKPGLLATRTRGLARLTGTLAGSLAATVFALLSALSGPAMLTAIAGAAYGAYTFRAAHYAVLSFFITATVVLMLDLVHGHALANAGQRVVATLLGGGIALLSALALPRAARP